MKIFKNETQKSIVNCLFLFNVVTFAQNLKVKESLSSYQNIIDKINSEFGSSIKIPDDKKEEVYNNISKMSLEEFEQNLRADYLQAIKNFSNDITITSESDQINPLLPRGATLTNQTQKCYFNNGIVGIDAQVSVDTSSAIVKYTKITCTFSKQPSSGNYFKNNSATILISNGDKKATITYKGNLYTQSGLLLLSNRTVTVTYTAGGGDIYGSFTVV